MDTAIFLAFAGVYALLLAFALSLVAKRRRLVVSDLAIPVVAALIYDNAVIGFGTTIGESPTLESLNAARFWLHAFCTPLLVLVAWHVLVRARIRWAMSRIAKLIVGGLTIALVVYEIVISSSSLVLEPSTRHGALSYSDADAMGGPPVMVLVVAATLFVAGVGVLIGQRWVWLLIGTVLMTIGSAVELPIESGAATNAFELILLTSIVATTAVQDRRTDGTAAARSPAPQGGQRP